MQVLVKQPVRDPTCAVCLVIFATIRIASRTTTARVPDTVPAVTASVLAGVSIVCNKSGSG